MELEKELDGKEERTATLEEDKSKKERGRWRETEYLLRFLTWS